MSEEGSSRFPADCVWLAPTPYRKPAPGRAYCCDPMRIAVADFCDQHDDPWQCNRASLVYNEAMDEYGVLVRERINEYVLIRHCPWCGAGLPASRRDEWFDALEARGFDDVLGLDAADLPPEFLTAAWRAPRRDVPG